MISAPVTLLLLALGWLLLPGLVVGVVIRWVVLCDGLIRTWQTRAPGLLHMDRVTAATLVYSDEAVRLYHIEPVGRLQC